MLVLLGIAFVAGLVTAISPCVLPVLPILLAGSATGTSRWRPLAIVAGLVGSFTLFTLAGAAILSALGLPDDFLRNLAIVLLFVLAATLIFPAFARVLERPFYFLTRRRADTQANGFVLGASVGLVFVPCAGPVFATVAALSATGDVGVRIVLVTLTYALGVALPMLAIAAGAQRLAGGLAFVRREAPWLRIGAGIVIAATALAIQRGVDQHFTTALPGYTESLQNDIERSSAAQRELGHLRGDRKSVAPTSSSSGPLAPNFGGIRDWINTPGGRPLSIRKLRGKVVLVDFWTYSCVNCLRALPHVRAWDAAYRKDGLVVVGVHTPEFAFERVPSNVETAVRKLDVRYPVALDNDYVTWNAFSNQYWPAEYLIDRSGRVRYTSFGEGEYGRTEEMIRKYLGEAAQPMTRVADRTPNYPMTPESYLGYERLDRLTNTNIVPDRFSTYVSPGPVSPNELAYDGTWRVTAQRIEAGAGARLMLGFSAEKIHLVLGGRGGVQVLVNGRHLRTVAIRGEPRLYTLARFPRPRSGLLELRFTPGLSAYAFTFG